MTYLQQMINELPLIDDNEPTLVSSHVLEDHLYAAKEGSLLACDGFRIEVIRKHRFSTGDGEVYDVDQMLSIVRWG